MTSEIRSNKIKNRAGLGTVTFSGTGAILSGIVTASDDFRANEIRNQSGLGTITVSNSGAVVAGILSATKFVGDGTGLTGNLSYSGNYIGMSDTPSSYTAGAFHRSNDAANGMQNSATLFEDSSGNIGIGENNPLSKLHVKKGSGDTRITIESGGNNVPFEVGVLGGASSGFYIANSSTLNNIFTSNSSDYVFLYGGGQQRIETTNTGVSISGVLDSTGDLQISDKIIHTGDTNTAIRFPLSDTITFETAGTERLRVDSAGNTTFSGNVSIGGTLTYEDVTNIDSVGVITARDGIDVYFNGNKRIETTNLGNNIVGLTTITPSVEFTDNTGSSNLYHLVFVDPSTNTQYAANVGVAKTLYQKWGGITYDDYDNTLNVSYMNAFKFRNIDTPAVLNNQNRMHLTLSNDASLPSTNNQSVALFECSSNAYITIGSGTGTNSRAGVLFANSSGNARGAVSYKESTETISFHTLSLSSSNERLTISESGAVLSGIITATNFVKADGSSLGSVTSDAQYNTKAGSNSGDAFSGTSAEKNTLFGYDTGTEINSGDDNTCIGYRSGESITSGGSNTLVGSITGERITTTGSNTALGYYCLAETTGGSNTAVGAWACKDSGNCTGNSAFGMWALYANSSGDYNVGVGFNAAYGIFSAPRDYIIGIGYEALKWSKGDYNIGIGYRAGYAGDSSAYNEGSHNITIGHYSGKKLSTGSDNTIIGADAGDALDSGSNNLILGHDAAASNTTVSNEITLGNANITKFRIPGINVILKANGGVPTQGHVLTVDANGEAGFAAASGGGGGVASDAQYNTVGGTGAGSAITSGGTYNTLFGYNAGNDINTGDYNTLIGYNAGEKLTTGQYNVAIGAYSLMKGTNTLCHSNVCVGYYAGENYSSSQNGGNKNVAIGYKAHQAGQTSGECVYIGYGAGQEVKSGVNNVAIGQNAGQGAYNQAGGSQNTSIGHESGKRFTTGENNSLLGVFSGDNITTGNDNVCIGANAGDSGTNNLTTGSNNILIGHDAAATASNVSNEITLGNGSIASLRCNVQTISSLSDARDKKNVIDLPEGLNFINNLRPVKFEWSTRDGNGKDGSYEHGFIAQDLQEAQKDNDADYLKLVMDNDPDRLEASYGKLVPILVKAIQELTLEVNKLKSNG